MNYPPPLLSTRLMLPGQKNHYRGKVREVYELENELLVVVTTDRLSAFDVVLKQGIPFKGQVLNQLANFFLDESADIVPNWKLSQVHPLVTIGRKAQTLPVEMVIRGYLTGHAWRLYQSGQRQICGVPLPKGMRQNQAFKEPIITPTTKAAQGQHDEDISRDEILRQGLVSEVDYQILEKYTRQLFARGQAIAKNRGLILVDTKYEFGKTSEGEIVLIDEVHTPDSSRYFYRATYEDHFAAGEPQKQLSKEFVREWLMEQGFQGKEGQEIPEMPDHFVRQVSERYIELFEMLTARPFDRESEANTKTKVREAILAYLR